MNKKLIYLISCLIFVACNSKEEEYIGPLNEWIVFDHIEPKSMYTQICDENASSFGVDIHIVAEDNNLENSGYHDTPENEIEQLIAKLINPNDYPRLRIPVILRYTTEKCNNITFTLFDKDDNKLADITDKAKILNFFSEYNLLIYGEEQRVGLIESGTSIKDYLSCKPMIFPIARIVFPNREKDILKGGNYIKTVIELDNGKIFEYETYAE